MLSNRKGPSDWMKVLGGSVLVLILTCLIWRIRVPAEETLLASFLSMEGTIWLACSFSKSQPTPYNTFREWLADFFNPKYDAMINSNRTAEETKDFKVSRVESPEAVVESRLHLHLGAVQAYADAIIQLIEKGELRIAEVRPKEID